MGFLASIKSFVDRVGREKIVLLVLILLIISIVGIYSTYSLYTSSDDVSIIDGMKTYKFILSSNNKTNSVTLDYDSSKYVSLSVSNPEKIRLKYGISYNSADDLTNVDVGYLREGDNITTGIIDGNSEQIVTIKIDNKSDHRVTLNFSLQYGVESGGDLVLPDGNNWVEKKFDEFPLSQAKLGSFIEYSGNNGCTGDSCLGENANYIDKKGKGYCYNYDYAFNSSGWQVFYVKDNYAYITSAGALECMDAYIIGKDSSEVNNNIINNLDSISLKYCNKAYAYNQKCDSDSAWTMDVNDLKQVIASDFNLEPCLNDLENKNCKFTNTIINNGSFYWLADLYHDNLLNWNPVYKTLSFSDPTSSLGIRPVLKFDSNVMVVGGSGTEDDPYIIENY